MSGGSEEYATVCSGTIFGSGKGAGRSILALAGVGVDCEPNGEDISSER